MPKALVETGCLWRATNGICQKWEVETTSRAAKGLTNRHKRYKSAHFWRAGERLNKARAHGGVWAACLQRVKPVEWREMGAVEGAQPDGWRGKLREAVRVPRLWCWGQGGLLCRAVTE